MASKPQTLSPAPKSNRLARREEREFYLFIFPWLIGLVLFDAGPILASLVIGFTDWSLLDAPKWAGLQNYAEMFKDPLVAIALWNSAYYGFSQSGWG